MEREKEDNRQRMQHSEITEAIIGCAFDVSNELGAGFVESVYQKSLTIALRDRGLRVYPEFQMQVLFRNQIIGDFYADLFVEDLVLVELKAVKAIAPEHQAQVINYLKAGSVEVGLLFNFGCPKLEFKRFTRRFEKGEG